MQLVLDPGCRHLRRLEARSVIDHGYLDPWPLTREPCEFHLDLSSAVLEGVETRLHHSQLNLGQGITGEPYLAAEPFDGEPSYKLGVRLRGQDETDALRLSHGRDRVVVELEREEEAKQPPRRLHDDFQSSPLEERR